MLVETVSTYQLPGMVHFSVCISTTTWVEPYPLRRCDEDVFFADDPREKLSCCILRVGVDGWRYTSQLYIL